MKKTTHYTGHRWTNDECKRLMHLWTIEAPLSEIAKEMNLTEYAVLKQVRRMRAFGIPLKRRTAGHNRGVVNKPWTKGEVEYLIRRRNEKADNEDIASELGRTWQAVQGMIYTLRKEGVDIAMRGMGVRRKWDPNEMKAVQLGLRVEKSAA